MLTDQQHPITPPEELIREWIVEAATASMADQRYIAIQAARWGFRQCIKVDAAWLEDKLQKARDQELEACCEWLSVPCPSYGRELRAARRPKPPSLAEQGQRILVENGSTLDGRVELDPEDVVTINAALKRLQELENNDN